MRKRDWLWLVTLPLLGTWFIDRVSKMWAENLEGFTFHGPIGTVLYHNHGAILGLFSTLPAVLRIVSLSTGGAFLIFTFFVLQYLLPIRSSILRAGMAVLLGGILGNVTESLRVHCVIVVFGQSRHKSQIVQRDCRLWGTVATSPRLYSVTVDFGAQSPRVPDCTA